VKSITTSLFSALACASALDKSIDHPALAALSGLVAAVLDMLDFGSELLVVHPASQTAAQNATLAIDIFKLCFIEFQFSLKAALPSSSPAPAAQ
jgi:hypothetical protein